MSAETIKQAAAIIKKMDLTKVDLKLVRKHLKDAGISHTGTADECVERLMVHQIQTGGKDLLECDVCHAFSAQKYADCPFCDGIDPSKSKAAPAAAAEVVETTGEETSEEPPARTSKAASKKTTTSKSNPPAATTSPAVAELASPSKKASKKAVAKKAPAKKAPSKKATVKPTASERSKALAKNEGKTEVLSARALDVEVTAIKKAQAKGTDALFEVGTRMIKIRENGLHTLRVDPETNKPIYKRLEDFTQAELGMTRVHANLIMNVVEGFKPEDVRDLGVAKLGLFVSLKSKETREELLDLARKGAPVSKIREEVRRLTDGGAERKRREGFRGTPAAGPRRAPGQSEPITVATTEQAITVPLLNGKGEQATKFADGLVGQEKTANGILITYKLVMLEGIGASLEVTRVRA